jgi:hypothetical protein
MSEHADAAFSTRTDFLLMIKRAQLICKYWFTTGASKKPTGVNVPVVSILLKNALQCR